MIRQRLLHRLIPIGLIFILAGCTASPAPVTTATNLPPSPLENAILTEDWQTVIAILEKDESKASDPVARLVMGHAKLATNNNNASMLLFLSVTEDEDLRQWVDWTNSLLIKAPANPVADYLSADAKARLGDFTGALQDLNGALANNKEFALALNARGTVLVLMNEWDEALLDFISVNQIAPKFADAYASLGTYWVLREAPEGAIEAFNEAIALNPDFALAYNGRGAAYFGQGEFERSAQDFIASYELNPSLIVPQLNQGFATSYAAQLSILANMDSQPGMSLITRSTQQEAQFQSQDQQLHNSIPDTEFWTQMKAWPWLPDSERQALISTYGLGDVQTALSHVIENEMIIVNTQGQQVIQQGESIAALSELQNVLNVTKVSISTVMSGMSLAKYLYQAGGWIPYVEQNREIPGQSEVLQAGGSYVIQSEAGKVLYDAVPSSLEPIPLAGSILNSGFNFVDAIVKDQLAQPVNQQAAALEQQLLHGNWLKGYLDTFPRAGDINANSAPSEASLPQGIFIASTQSFTDLGAVAASISINYNYTTLTNDTPITVIASDSTFRSDLLQLQLGLQGLGSVVVPPGVDVQMTVDQYGSPVVVGIQQAEQFRLAPLPTENFFPTGDIGGTASGGGGMPPPIVEMPKQIDWTPYVPPSTADQAPGGISTEQIAQAFVDKGNWPVMTSFGLAYRFH